MTTLSLFSAVPFHAARSLNEAPAGSPARRRHGHSFLASLALTEAEAPVEVPGAEVDAVHALLSQITSTLDYSDLDTQFDLPSDMALASHLAASLPEQISHKRVGVRSTSMQGVVDEGDGSFDIWRTFHFESAHHLPNVPAGHQCGRMHGHSFEATLHLRISAANGVATQQHYDRMAQAWQACHDVLDHQCLNDIPGLENPTSEMLAAWLYERLQHELTELSGVAVNETATAGCLFDGAAYRIWKEQRFEGATQLEQAPEGHPTRRMHGHSYLIRLHLVAELDAVMGWTLDYGDVKQVFKPCYKQLDHHRLDQLPGITSGGSLAVATWVAEQLLPNLPQLTRVDLHEGRHGGVMWHQSTLPAITGEYTQQIPF